ncbi:hypothetical protein [Acinetobacter sp. MD2(2019)]|uniref:hypothetical protein n=1 Tax=Acinetobacter sp. MD2(2019) TaxID=2605273 RepID=UPI002D7781CB|nr:hypothetical protein [Acinetobacter sp. MD2(2019)]
MFIKFIHEQHELFLGLDEEELALWNWNRLKTLYANLAEKFFNNNEKKGVEFLVAAQTKVKRYLDSVEDYTEYNIWRLAYGELCFILNDNKLDDAPWTRSILEERLWPPFRRIDILVGVVESSLKSPSSQKFYQSLGASTVNEIMLSDLRLDAVNSLLRGVVQPLCDNRNITTLPKIDDVDDIDNLTSEQNRYIEIAEKDIEAEYSSISEQEKQAALAAIKAKIKALEEKLKH